MDRSLSASVLAALAVGALLCGCGSSKVAAQSGNGSKATVSTSAPARPASADIEPVPAAVARCERAVKTTPKLSAGAKAELEFVCRRNINGVIQEDRGTDRVVCDEVVNAMPLRDDSAKRRSFSACDATAIGQSSH